MAKIKVILKSKVGKLGDAGDIAVVAGGYARNYLIPRGLAVPATRGNITQAESWRRSRTERVGRELVAAGETRDKLQSGPVVVTAQAGPDGRLFGSVTAPQLASAIAAQLGVEVDRHDVHLEEPIRHLGFHEVRVRVLADVVAAVIVEVTAS